MKLIITAIVALGLALAAIPVSAAPVLPSQCPGTIADYNVITTAEMTIDLDYGSGLKAVGIYSGTDDADFIVVSDAGGGVVAGEGGNDCIVFATGAYFAVVDGGDGNDVIISNVNPLYEIADGAAGTDRCKGFPFDTCELH